MPEIAALTIPVPFAFIIPLTDPAPPLLLPMTVPLHTPLVIVPTLVKLEVVIVLAKLVPVKVPASAPIVILAVPSNGIPLIFLAVVNFVALSAVPDNVPTKLSEVIELNPATEV